jgi:hypothetical protein
LREGKRGEVSSPSAEASERRSPRLDGANGGEGLFTPIGEGGTREELGEVCVGRAGRLGRATPLASGDGWRREGEGEWIEGEPEESVEDLNGWTGLMFGLRMGSGPGAEGRS